MFGKGWHDTDIVYGWVTSQVIFCHRIGEKTFKMIVSKKVKWGWWKCRNCWICIMLIFLLNFIILLDSYSSIFFLFVVRISMFLGQCYVEEVGRRKKFWSCSLFLVLKRYISYNLELYVYLNWFMLLRPQFKYWLTLLDLGRLHFFL